MKSVTVLLVALLTTYVVNGQFQYKDCTSSSNPVGKLQNVTVTGCDQTPCTVKKGNSYTIKVTFSSMENTDQSWAIVHGILDGNSVLYPIDNPDGCKNSGIECPIKMGSTYTYTSSLKILNEFPDIKVLVKWELADTKSGGQDLFCFETLIQVVG